MRYLSLFALLALLGGCASGKVNQAAGAEHFTLRVLDATQLDGGSAAIDYTVQELGGRIEVQVRAADARELKACYFELDYDSARLNPVAATATRLLAAGGGAVVELGVLNQPGTVIHGQVLAKWEQQAGFDGYGVLATVVFERRPYAQPAPRAASIDFFADQNRRRLQMTYNADAATANWYYVNPGDYDQNGEINITDLTALARFFGDHVDYNAPGATLTALAVADGDANGEVNMGDITVMAPAFGATVSEVRVYSTGSTELYPAYPVYPLIDPGAGADFVGSVAFSQAQGDPSVERLRFSRPIGTHLHRWVWAQVVTSEGPGIPSGYGWASPHQAAYDVYDPVGYQLQFDGTSLHWYYNLWCDWDGNGAVTIQELSFFGTVFGQQATNDVSTRGWLVDVYRNGSYGMDDFQMLAQMLNVSFAGYAVFGTDQAAQVPQDPHAEELLAPLGSGEAAPSGPPPDPYERDEVPRGGYNFTPQFDPSGWSFWVRPVIGSDQYGTRSGVVQVP